MIERLADAGYRVIERFRSPRAFEVARKPGTATDFAALAGARQCLVVSFKRSGEPVPTAVNFGLDGERLFFRCEPRSAKVRRISHDPHVRVGPCNLRAKPTGPLTEGRARIVPQADVERSERAVAANWNALTGLLERGLERMPVEVVYVEVEPSAAEETRV